jgi:hypothetical protein
MCTIDDFAQICAKLQQWAGSLATAAGRPGNAGGDPLEL